MRVLGETPRLVIRNWGEQDRELFHLINSDDRVMEFFPFRRDRAEADRIMNLLRAAIDERGWGFAALERKADRRCIGFAGLGTAGLAPLFPGDAVEIGWRLAPDAWGLGYASEAARDLLAFGFDTLALSEIVSFAVWNNRRSTAVMERIGMDRDAAADFDHPLVPAGLPWLKRHVVYRLSNQRWAAANRPGGR